MVATEVAVTVSLELVVLLALLGLVVILIKGFVKTNKDFVAAYVFPESIKEHLRNVNKDFSEADIEEILNGLRQFYTVCGMNNLRWCMMPSKLIDEALRASTYLGNQGLRFILPESFWKIPAPYPG
jgi:hypothetical protein